MNQKELLDREVVKYYYYRGAFITCLMFAFFFSFLGLVSVIFVGLILICLIIALLMLNEMGNLNLKWTAIYKPKEEVKGRKK